MLVGWVSAFGCSGKAKSRGNIYQASQRFGSHFLHHSPSVRLHRELADAELATDLLIQFADDHQAVGRLRVSIAPGRRAFPYGMGSRNRFAQFARGVKCCETVLADQDHQ